MLIIPDLFTPYIEGRETAINRNWQDMANYNSVQADQMNNFYNLATMSPRINNQWYGADNAMIQNRLNRANFPLGIANTIAQIYGLQGAGPYIGESAAALQRNNINRYNDWTGAAALGAQLAVKQQYGLNGVGQNGQRTATIPGELPPTVAAVNAAANAANAANATNATQQTPSTAPPLVSSHK